MKAEAVAKEEAAEAMSAKAEAKATQAAEAGRESRSTQHDKLPDAAADTCASL